MAAKQGEVIRQLDFGAFPGFISEMRGELAPRLKVVLTLTVLDRHTGEKMQRSIPFESNEAEAITPWMEKALQHRRTQADVLSFIKGRDGDE